MCAGHWAVSTAAGLGPNNLLPWLSKRFGLTTGSNKAGGNSYFFRVMWPSLQHKIFFSKGEFKKDVTRKGSQMIHCNCTSGNALFQANLLTCHPYTPFHSTK